MSISASAFGGGSTGGSGIKGQRLPEVYSGDGVTICYFCSGCAIG